MTDYVVGWISYLELYAERNNIGLDQVNPEAVFKERGWKFTEQYRKTWRKIVEKWRKNQGLRQQSHASPGASPESREARTNPVAHKEQPVRKPAPIALTVQQILAMQVDELLREQLLAVIRLLQVLHARAQQLERIERLTAEMERRIVAAAPCVREVTQMIEGAILRAKLDGDW